MELQEHDYLLMKERNMVRRKQEEAHNSQNVNYKSIYNIFPQIFSVGFLYKNLKNLLK